MTQARRKFVVLPILILGSWTVLAAQPRTAALRTIHFAPDVQATNATLRQALVDSMDRIQDQFKQAQFIESKENAAYALIDLRIKSTPSTVTVSAKYRYPGTGWTSPIPPACAQCEADALRVEGLFYELIDKTLLDPSHGLYRPMRIRQCELVEPLRLSTIRASVEPVNGVALERFSYLIADPANAAGSQWTTRLLTPRLEVTVLDENDPSSATFKVFGNAKAISVFSKDCRAMPLLAVQPRAALLSRGERNQNVSRGN